jgi:predicted histone-like DNA-binding protein
MRIKFDIHSIKNSNGSGEQRFFARPQYAQPLSPKQLEERISHSCTLTAADIRGVLAALSHVMTTELAAGHRVHLPGIGYFALKVSLNMPEDKKKVKANHLYASNIRFRPETSVMTDVRQRVSFKRMEGTTRSHRYNTDEMAVKVKTYLERHRFINRKIMEEEFGLRKSAALRWLKQLTEQGTLVREGPKSSPVYMSPLP